MTHAPRVAFLGVKNHGGLALTPNPNVFHYDVIGLRTCVLSYIYPLVMDPFQCVIAAYDLAASPLGPIEFRNANGDGSSTRSTSPPLSSPEPGADPSAQLPGPVSVVAFEGGPTTDGSCFYLLGARSLSNLKSSPFTMLNKELTTTLANSSSERSVSSAYSKKTPRLRLPQKPPSLPWPANSVATYFPWMRFWKRRTARQEAATRVPTCS